jgi:hypothetical protein
MEEGHSPCRGGPAWGEGQLYSYPLTLGGSRHSVTLSMLLFTIPAHSRRLPWVTLVSSTTPAALRTSMPGAIKEGAEHRASEDDALRGGARAGRSWGWAVGGQP